ncbi:685_t:CDS:2 [Racocetra fulgida]|uniref:685_t:CDS:1 n=1 Tax=Racocetra fulgida TaxID=60492 RepID=A0A9N9ACY7_9GLOM|nr:685_t:CDS:2 [Racocetra fulgida]
MIEENSDVKTLSKNNRKTLVGGGEYDKEEKCDLPKRLLEKEALQHECEKWIEKVIERPTKIEPTKRTPKVINAEMDELRI